MPKTLVTDSALGERVLSVSQFTAQLKGVVESHFSSVWVAGEISNFSRPQSGHCYFTLKDDGAQLRAVIWRNASTRLKFDLHDGLEVVCRGSLDVYPPRGSYQMVVTEIEPRGIGALELALRKLREKFAAEGLFDADRKRLLPAFPRRIGFVTSPTGAAIHDFLQVIKRRWSGVEVYVFPARVQGTGAAEEIAAGIKLANRIKPALDVLVVGRGGGSLEDLWAFNEEPVVRAIAESRVPIVSAVGHEIDVTLADLVADVRALTPTEAAERVVPSSADVSEMLRHFNDRLRRSLTLRTANIRQRLDALASRPALARPLDMVHNQSRAVDEFATRLHSVIKLNVRDQQQRLAAISGQLDALSPLAVLGRGYSLTQEAKTGKLVTAANQLKVGQEIRTRLSAGEVVSVVSEIENR
ncbi:MAG: exodeoxyribonuclease VII large subunit [Bythopirellula sp.]|nr:exodeoxyribonuclease VII large subunit [Bythopirellula sp.]